MIRKVEVGVYETVDGISAANLYTIPTGTLRLTIIKLLDDTLVGKNLLIAGSQPSLQPPEAREHCPVAMAAGPPASVTSDASPTPPAVTLPR